MRVKPIDEYVSDKSQTSTTLAKENFLNEKVSNIETVGLLDDIHDFIFPNSIDAQLRDMNLSKEELGRILGISIDDETIKLESISQYRNANYEGKQVIIKIYNSQTNDYEKHTYYLIYKDGKYVIESINHSGTTEYGVIDENEIQTIKRIAHLDESFEVISYEYVNGSKKVKVKDDQGKIYYCVISNNDVLQQVIFPDGGVLQCELTNERKNQIRGLINLNSNVDIFGYQTINIDGKSVNFYITEDMSIKNIYDQSSRIKNSIKLFPEYTKNLFLSNPDFIGFFIGAKENVPNLTVEIDNWAAFASENEYIYIDSAGDINITVIEHEMGHIIDYILGNNTYHTSNPEFLALYDKYKASIITAFGEFGGYGPFSGFSEMPNERELFAKATVLYINTPDELRATMPDLYDYMDKALRGT